MYYFSDLTGQLRLIAGKSSSEGRLEVFYDGGWNTICDDDWDSVDATVACKQLGHYSGQPVLGANFGQGTGRIGLDDVRCTGQEDQLIDCAHRGWFNHNCSHSEDAGVVCIRKLFLQLSQI